MQLSNSKKKEVWLLSLIKKILKSFGNSITTIQNETVFAACNIFKLFVNIYIEQRKRQLGKNGVI